MAALLAFPSQSVASGVYRRAVDDGTRKHQTHIEDRSVFTRSNTGMNAASRLGSLRLQGFARRGCVEIPAFPPVTEIDFVRFIEYLYFPDHAAIFQSKSFSITCESRAEELRPSLTRTDGTSVLLASASGDRKTRLEVRTRDARR